MQTHTSAVIVQTYISTIMECVGSCGNLEVQNRAHV